MAGAQIDIGTGASIAFGTSTYGAQLISLSHSGITRPSIETTHTGVDLTPGTTEVGNATRIPGDIADAGQITAEVYFDPSLTPPLTVTAPEVITITYSIPTAGDSAAAWVGSGFCTEFSCDAKHEEVMTATLVIALTASVAITAAA
jgi:hypothetical protein